MQTIPRDMACRGALLALGVVLGSGIAAYFLAAPAVFEVLTAREGSTALAGELAGEIFRRRETLALPLLLPPAAWAFLAWRGSRARVALVALSLLLMAIAMLLIERLYITPAIHAMREQLGDLYGSVSGAPADDPVRRRFGLFHGLSMMRALVELLCTATAFLLMPGARLNPGACDSTR